MTKNTNADRGIPQPALHKFGQVGPFRHVVKLVPFHVFGEEKHVLITFYDEMGANEGSTNSPTFFPKALSIYHAQLESPFGGVHAVIPDPIETQGCQFLLIC